MLPITTNRLTSTSLRSLCSITMAALFCSFQSPKAADAQVNINPDRRYDQNVYLSAHNSYANSDQGYVQLTADQRLSVTAQLDHGCTCLLPDVYLMRQHHRTLGGYDAEIYFGNDTHVRDSGFQNDPLEIALAHNPTSVVGGYTLLSGFPIDWPRFRSFRDYLQEVRHWMDAHQNVVITLVLESYVSVPSIMQQTFEDAGLQNRIFFADRPNANFPAPDGSDWDVRMWGWPTLRQMADNGRTLVVFSSMGVRSGQPTDGLPYQWGDLVENVYGDDSLQPGKSFNVRSESDLLSNKLLHLFFMNYFPTFNTFGPDYQGADTPLAGIWDYSRLNSINSLKGAVLQNTQVAGRFPNFIAVNFFDTGDKSNNSFLSGPTEAAYFFNNQWDTLPRVTASVGGPKPNAAGWYNKPQTVALTGTASYPNGIPAKVTHVVLNVKLNGGIQSIIENAPLTFGLTEGISTGTFCALVDDHSSRSNTIGYMFKADFTPPTTSIAITETPSSTGWYTGDVHVQLSATDNLSGVKATHFKTGSVFQTYAGPFTLSEGTNVVEYFSEDIASNQEHSTKQTVRIDKTAPVTTAAFSPAPNSDGWNNTDVQVTLNARDSTSGIEETDYRFGNTKGTYSTPFTISNEGTTDLTFSSMDRAGNREGDHHANLRIDKHAPQTTPSIVGDITLGKPAQIDLHASDDLSGVKTISYRLDGSTTHSTPNNQVHFTVTSAGQHTLECWSLDRAGNAEAHQTYTFTIAAVARDVTNLISITRGGYTRVAGTNTFAQRVTLKNISSQSIPGPISIVLNSLTTGVALLNKTGVTAAITPTGSPYIDSDAATLLPGASVSVVLQFDNPDLKTINYTLRVLAGQGVR